MAGRRGGNTERRLQDVLAARRKDNASIWAVPRADRAAVGRIRRRHGAGPSGPGELGQRTERGYPAARRSAHGRYRLCRPAWRTDRKSTRLNSSTNAHLVCRLLLVKKTKIN